jgi:deoxyadenosine/deoxycytidine kinase
MVASQVSPINYSFCSAFNFELKKAFAILAFFRDDVKTMFWPVRIYVLIRRFREQGTAFSTPQK